jgi:hypothetical protein
VPTWHQDLTGQFIQVRLVAVNRRFSSQRLGQRSRLRFRVAHPVWEALQDLFHRSHVRGDGVDDAGRMNKADLTWGHDNQACMGKNVARCEMYKLMATLHSTFDVSLNLPSPSETKKQEN